MNGRVCFEDKDEEKRRHDGNLKVHLGAEWI